MAAETDETIAVGPIYMAGPITAAAGRTVADHVARAVLTLRYLTERRIAAICPQLSGGVAGLEAVPYEDWMAVDFVLLAACRAVLVLPGWESSAGTKREIAEAGRLGIPVFFTVRTLLAFLGVAARGARPPAGAGKG